MLQQSYNLTSNGLNVTVQLHIAKHDLGVTEKKKKSVTHGMGATVKLQRDIVEMLQEPEND